MGQLWHFITEPLAPMLGPRAWIVISLSLMIVAGGAFVALAPALLTGVYQRVVPVTSSRTHPQGQRETAYRGELRVKLAFGLIAGGLAMILSFLLRLLNTPGFTTRILPALTIIAILIAGGYSIFYRALIFPALVAECRRVDTRERAGKREDVKKQKSINAQTQKQIDANGMPNTALYFMIGAPFLFYIVYAGFTQGHDHALHMLGSFVVLPFLGYIVGLAVSLGSSLPRGSYQFVRGQQRHPSRTS